MTIDDKKSYRIVECSVGLPRKYSGGRFISASPLGAARKAVRSIYNKTNGHPKSVKFTLVETTRGSKHKEFSYEGKKVKLSRPIHINRDGNDIVVEYEYNVHAL